MTRLARTFWETRLRGLPIDMSAGQAVGSPMFLCSLDGVNSTNSQWQRIVSKTSRRLLGGRPRNAYKMAWWMRQQAIWEMSVQQTEEDYENERFDETQEPPIARCTLLDNLS